MHDVLLKIWYGSSWMRFILWPFSWIYQGVVWVRYQFWLIKKPQKPSVPVIVVGNLTVGGVGKTPLVIALVQAFQAKGVRVGVVSRGYKATVKHFPYAVTVADNPQTVGDEPLLIVKQTGCPLVIAPDRTKAIQQLVADFACELIISDDGLQHYAMGRMIEIAVMDGQRGVGNGFCLPAGPLRERISRLNKVDFLITNGVNKHKVYQHDKAYTMHLNAQSFLRVKDETDIPVDQIESPIIAVAAIGHPARFFSLLTDLGLTFTPHIFRDHYFFSEKDLAFNTKSLIMTEKDAVKCQLYAKDFWYFLRVQATLEESFWDALYAHPAVQPLLTAALR